MKSIKRIFAIVFVMSLICTGAMTQYVFGSDNAYIYLHKQDMPYQYRSPHRYSYTDPITKDTHNGYAPAIYRLLSGENNETVSLGYCCDLLTSVGEIDTYYKRLNLEDAGYYSEDAAKHIRSILAGGYWKEADAGAPDLSVLKKAAGIPERETLTAAEALAATQYAIWHYSNDSVENFNIYYNTQPANQSSNVADPDSVNASESPNDKTSEHIQKVYNYLIGLKGTEPTSVIWDFEEDGFFITASDAETSDDSILYNAAVKFRLAGSEDENNKLTLTATPVMNSGVEAVAEQKISLEDLKKTGGYYTVTFKNLTAEQISGIEKINFTLDGTQKVARDVYFYEPVDGRNMAQCFVGFAEGETPVHREWTVELEEKSVGLIKYDEDSAVTAENAAHAAQLESQGMIKVSDGGNGTYAEYAFPVAGAGFRLYAQEKGSDKAVKAGPVVYTDENGEVSWKILASADNISYYCKEVEAPKGYVLPTGKITYDLSSDEARQYISNCHDTGSITISKAVEGMNTTQHFNFEVQVDFSTAAAYARLNDEEKTISSDEAVWETPGSCTSEALHEISWITDEENDIRTGNIRLAPGETLTINNLPVGAKCTVTELDEEGNAVSDNKAFAYGEAFYVTGDAVQEVSVSTPEPAGSDKETSNNNTINFVNEKRITITKTDITDDEELAGAELKVSDKDTGEVIDSWISTEEAHVIQSRLENGKTYIITEVTAPEGYGCITTDIEFIINEDGSITSGAPVSEDSEGNDLGILVQDSRIHFQVNKADLTNGEELAGSEITIYDKETGEKAAGWISDGNGSHDFGQYLTAGREYILRETVAPDGYTYIQDTEFKVNRDGTIETDLNTAPAKAGARAAADETPVYLVEDDITRVSIAKVDADGNAVTGAKLAVKDAQTGETAAEWTSQSSAKEINGVLTAGRTYILTEIETPEGYQKAEDIEFTVPQQPEKIQIEMVDRKTGGAGGVSTGDRTRIGLCLILMTASMLLATGAVCFRRKTAR